MNILALDTGIHTGWATLMDCTIESGVQDFTKRRGESNGLMFLRFNSWLNEMQQLSMIKIDLVVFEQAHHRGGYATEIGVGLTTRVQEFACRIKAEYMAVHSGTLKKFITGSGKASKEDMMKYFEEKRGRKPIDDNEADAYCLLMFTCKTIGEKIKC